jgi:hypothetical protein
MILKTCGYILSIAWQLGLATFVTAACSSSHGARRDTAVAASPGAIAASPSPSASYGLKLIEGPGFTFAVPKEAIVDREQRDSHGNLRWRVHAPVQTITASLGTGDTNRFTDDRPLYSLTISTSGIRAGQSLKAWGDSIVAADEAKADELSKGEWGGIETVAGQSAYLREPTCGDCGDYIFTFARGNRRVEVEYTIDTAEPLAVRKHGLYALILSTFRWSS